jgi:hypothetical protein
MNVKHFAEKMAECSHLESVTGLRNPAGELPSVGSLGKEKPAVTSSGHDQVGSRVKFRRTFSTCNVSRLKKNCAVNLGFRLRRIGAQQVAPLSSSRAGRETEGPAQMGMPTKERFAAQRCADFAWQRAAG